MTGWDLLRAGRFEEARRAAEAGLAKASADARAHLLHARCLHALGDVAAANTAAARVIARIGADVATVADAGTILSHGGRHDQAIDAFERAVALRPDDPSHRFNLAMEQRFLGHMRAAEDNCDRVIAADPGAGEAWLIRSGLRRQTEADNHVSAIRARLVAGMADWRGRAQLLYALAKELEDLGDHRASFAALAEGAALRRRHMQVDVSIDIARIDAMIAGFPAEAFAVADVDACADDAPIFVVGMPRTGTTLVERILSTHPEVDSAGELTAFTEALMARMRYDGFRGGPPEAMVGAARSVDPAALGRAYLDRAAPFRRGAPRFIDKLPLNFLYCGLIARALPNAQIVHVRRDPMDTCYAVFKTWFESAYPFSYDLAEIAGYYAAYRRLMDHWDRVLPGRVVSVDYEGVVRDVDAEARRLIAACGLPWDPAVRCRTAIARPLPPPALRRCGSPSTSALLTAGGPMLPNSNRWRKCSTVSAS